MMEDPSVVLGGLTGFVLRDRYEFVSQIGSGIYATVYKVNDREAQNESETTKAIKVIPYTELSQNLVKEGEIMMQNDHPNLLKVYDLIREDNTKCYMVMEYCDGKDLCGVLARRRRHGQAIEESTIIKWLIQLAQALQYIHTKGIIHRDIQPRNLLLHEGNLKLGDFGLSSVLKNSPDVPHTTVGEAFYMSPEMVRNEGYNQKSDIWSLGCILYELVTLKKAFEGDVMSVFIKIANIQLPPWPETYSKGLQDIFQSALSAEPSERPSAEDLLATPILSEWQDRSPEGDDSFPDDLEDEVDIVVQPAFDAQSQKSIEAADDFEYFGNINDYIVPCGSSKGTADRDSSDSSAEDSPDIEVRVKGGQGTASRESWNPLHLFYKKVGAGDDVNAPSKETSSPPPRPPPTYPSQAGKSSARKSEAPPPPSPTPAPAVAAKSALPRSQHPDSEVLRAQSGQNSPEDGSKHVVNFLVRLKHDDPKCVYIDCCKKEFIKDRLCDLEASGFTKGPLKSRDIVLRDNTNVLIKTSGPVQLDIDGTGCSEFSILFNSSMDDMHEEGLLNPCDEFESATETVQRAFVNFYVEQSKISTIERSRSQCRLSSGVEHVLLCALPLVITGTVFPSTDQVDEVVKPKHSVGLFQTPQILNFNPVMTLTRGLEPSVWIELAMKLGYDSSSVDSFKKYQNEALPYMLLDWLSRKPDNSNKIVTLSNAVNDIGSKDLAALILQKAQTDKEGRSFERVIDDLQENDTILREQERFLRLLGLSDADIVDAPSHLYAESRSLKRCLRERLRVWYGQQSTKDATKIIIDCLEDMGLKRLAGDIAERHLGDR